VRKLHLQTSPSNDFSTTPFGTIANIQRVRIGRMGLNGAQFGEVSAQVPATDELFTGRPYRGILGFLTFADLVWTFDGPGKQIILRKGLAGNLPADYLPMDTDHDGPQWPMRVSHGRAVVPMLVDGAASPTRINTVLDTGCVWDFLLPAYLQIELPEVPVVARGQMLSASGVHPLNASLLAGSLTIGKHSFSLPLVAYVPSPNGLAAVGAPVLKDFVITFDMPQARVWIQKPARQIAAR
jgi:hypothetical protein